MIRHACFTALSLLLVALAGCGDEGAKSKVFGGGTGSDEDGGAPGEEDDGPGPTIKFLSPKPATDPNGGTVLVSPKVTVRCSVVRGPDARASDVDPATVKVRARDPQTDKIVEAPTKALDDQEYEAKFDVEDFSNGTVAFECSAADIDGNVKLKTLETLLDLGPSIEILEPKDKSVHSLESATSIQFRVKASKLTGGDKEAGVKTIALHVAGVPIGFKKSGTDTYQASVNFQDQALFGTAPSSAEIVVTAKNARTPKVAERKAVSKITIDSAGPTIVVISPKNTSLVRATVAIAFMATDPSGVDPNSVIAKINKDEKVITDWTIAGSMYTQTFDTRDFAETQTQLTINISVTDSVGNISTAPILLRLDNVAPLVSMDPPLIREANKGVCSMAFDPLGDGASDLDMVANSIQPMVFVNDRTNKANADDYGYNADVDPKTIEVYARHADGTPLLIDKDHDGQCDEINYDDLPELDQPTVIDLQPVKPSGNAWYTSAVSFAEPGHTTTVCKKPAAAVKAPPTLCPAAGMTRAVRGWLENKPDAVYALNPSGAATGECTGTTWVIKNVVGNGWACVAARAMDNIGNVGVSPPLRICVGASCSGLPPSCVDSCSLPDDYGSNWLWPL